MNALNPPATPREEAAYATYKARLNIRGVHAINTRETWIENRRKLAAGSDCVFRTLPGAALPDGWYKHIFWPGSNDVNERRGPFATREEAEAS